MKKIGPRLPNELIKEVALENYPDDPGKREAFEAGIDWVSSHFQEYINAANKMAAVLTGFNQAVADWNELSETFHNED